MNASVRKEENMNANQVIKEQLARFSDPEPGMSEQERERYHQNILAKIESGKKLSSQELAYLRVNDPMAYQKARRMEQKRQWLEQQMKKCKSKQEVRKTTITCRFTKFLISLLISCNNRIPVRILL